MDKQNDMKPLQSAYYAILKLYVSEFCKKHGVPYEHAHILDDRNYKCCLHERKIVQLFCTSGTMDDVTMDDIRFDIDLDIPFIVFVEWEEYRTYLREARKGFYEKEHRTRDTFRDDFPTLEEYFHAGKDKEEREEVLDGWFWSEDPRDAKLPEWD